MSLSSWFRSKRNSNSRKNWLVVKPRVKDLLLADELSLALNELLIYLDGSPVPKYREAAQTAKLLFGRLRQLENELAQGVLMLEEARVERNRIRQGIDLLMGSLEQPWYRVRRYWLATFSSILVIVGSLLLIPVLFPERGFKVKPIPKMEGNKLIYDLYKFDDEYIREIIIELDQYMLDTTCRIIGNVFTNVPQQNVYSCTVAGEKRCLKVTGIDQAKKYQFIVVLNDCFALQKKPLIDFAYGEQGNFLTINSDEIRERYDPDSYNIIVEKFTLIHWLYIRFIKLILASLLIFIIIGLLFILYN